MLAVIIAASVSPRNSTALYGTPRFLEKSVPSRRYWEMIGKHKRRQDQRHHQHDQLVAAFHHQRKVSDQPGGKGLGHLVFIRQIIGNPTDHIVPNIMPTNGTITTSLN